MCKDLLQAQLSCNHLVINILQNLFFCIPKAAVLHGKSVGSAAQKSRFRNAKTNLLFSIKLSLQNQSNFFVKPTYMRSNMRTYCKGFIYHFPPIHIAASSVSGA